jgi:hypothetical protein
VLRSDLLYLRDCVNCETTSATEVIAANAKLLSILPPFQETHPAPLLEQNFYAARSRIELFDLRNYVNSKVLVYAGWESLHAGR